MRQMPDRLMGGPRVERATNRSLNRGTIAERSRAGAAFGAVTDERSAGIRQPICDPARDEQRRAGPGERIDRRNHYAPAGADGRRDSGDIGAGFAGSGRPLNASS